MIILVDNLEKVKGSLEYLEKLDIISYDSETTGFSPYTDILLSVQLGNYNIQYVIDCKKIDIKLYKNLLEDKNKLFLFQNYQFDGKFLFHNNIKVRNVYDTLLAECILTTGYSDDERDVSLKGLGKKYCDVELDKSIRGMINYKGLCSEVIEYAANDIKYLEQIREKQLIEINKYQLERTLELENEVVKVFTLMCYQGIPINPIKWNSVATEVDIELKSIINKLNSIYLEESKNNIKLRKYVDTQLDLFIEDIPEKCTVNWSSNKQKLQILNYLKLNMSSVSDKELQRNKQKHKLIPELINYSKFNKLSTSFGKDFLKFINPITKRLHPEIWQILSTGRISMNNPNLLQIPGHGRLGDAIRAAFECKDGYVMVGGDYSGMELRLIAEYSQDPLWIDTFINDGDLHSILCSKTFNIPLESVKEPFPHKPDFKYRDIQKNVNFMLSYGGSEFKLSDMIQISIKEAKNIINKFFSVVPKVKQFLDALAYLGVKNGYIRTDPYWKRIRWFPKLNKEDFKSIGEVERASKNTVPQGSNGNIIKQALINLQNIIDENNYDIKIILAVYDEIRCEVREDLAEMWAKVMEEEMIKAAQILIKSIPVKVDININKYWKK